MLLIGDDFFPVLMKQTKDFIIEMMDIVQCQPFGGNCLRSKGIRQTTTNQTNILAPSPPLSRFGLKKSDYLLIFY
ncbi:hypothetical protein DERP_009622 [Dermatophagoides pteronyssinus]|uniref:Uncharacterized protein n=1 Tax=Dermatophagoides pteronyssinus TaxID=6956 RepID=A0ABQ8JAV4_DERPT|nr:hypothetical protein DERP_009622 [Dermatophagoides pteronyssinus]